MESMCVSREVPLEVDAYLNICLLFIFLFFCILLLAVLCLIILVTIFYFTPLGGSLSYKKRNLVSKLSVSEESSFILSVIEANVLKQGIA